MLLGCPLSGPSGSENRQVIKSKQFMLGAGVGGGERSRSTGRSCLFSWSKISIYLEVGLQFPKGNEPQPHPPPPALQ